MSLLSAIPQSAYITTGNGQICLNWGIVAGATSYSIQRSTDGVTFATIANPSVNLYVDTTGTVGTLYYYQIASVSLAGTSGYQAYGTNDLKLSIVPCLPGQINLGYLRQQARLRADKLMSQFLTDDEWNFNINQACFELYDLLVSKYGDDYFLALPLLVPMTGLNSYPIPDGSNYPVNGANSPALLKLVGIDVNVNGGPTSPLAGWVPLSRFNWSDRDRYTVWPGQAGALNNFYKMGYRMMGNQFEVIPANTAQTLRIWYVPMMVQLLLDTDMLPFSISGWSEYVLTAAAILGLLKEESFDQANVLATIKGVIIQRIEYAAENRDVGQPNTVSNTRQTMGDLGFGGYGNGFGSSSIGGGFGV